MGEWTSRITEHRIWNLMKALGPSLDQAVQINDVAPDAIEAIERLRTVLALCGKKLGGSDPLTVAPSSLDSLAGAIQSQKSEVKAFVNDRNSTHRVNANGAW